MTFIPIITNATLFLQNWALLLKIDRVSFFLKINHFLNKTAVSRPQKNNNFFVMLCLFFVCVFHPKIQRAYWHCEVFLLSVALTCS